MRRDSRERGAVLLGLSEFVVASALSSVACGKTNDGVSGAPDRSGTGGALGTLQTGGAAGAHPSGGGGAGTTGNGGVQSAGGAGVEATSGSGGASAVGGANGLGDAGELTDASGIRDAGGNDVTPADNSCLDGITDYVHDGPFKFETKTSDTLRFFVPTVPVGCKVPVVYLGGGTGAVCDPYVAILQRLATHGFLGTCYEAITSGEGTECVTALDTAHAMFPSLADDKLGVSGHEQGGGATFLCVQLAEVKWGKSKIYTGLAMEPASGLGGSDWMAAYARITSPMFMFSGTADGLTPESFVQQSFDALSDTDEAYWYAAVGATGVPVPVVPTQQVAVPWFRWKLLHDRKACDFFKQMPDGADWDARQSQNDSPCN